MANFFDNDRDDKEKEKSTDKNHRGGSKSYTIIEDGSPITITTYDNGSGLVTVKNSHGYL